MLHLFMKLDGVAQGKVNGKVGVVLFSLLLKLWQTLPEKCIRISAHKSDKL